MTAVLVHGVPETERVWDALRAELERSDVVAPSLPGFGCPMPDGFIPTKEGYLDWLIGEIEQLGEPVDLVGHDWGGILTVRLVSVRPDLVRTWATDSAGVADPDYVWHDIAQVWQTPGEGESFMDGWLALPQEVKAAAFSGVAATDPVRAMADAIDGRMTDAILMLYRSAAAVHEEWGPGFADIAKPGAVLVANDDPFLEPTRARRSAARAGARVLELDGQGHWWMLGDAAGAARLLGEFWASAA